MKNNFLFPIIQIIIITFKVITFKVITFKIITFKVITFKVITFKIITFKIITFKITIIIWNKYKKLEIHIIKMLIKINKRKWLNL